MLSEGVGSSSFLKKPIALKMFSSSLLLLNILLVSLMNVRGYKSIFLRILSIRISARHLVGRVPSASPVLPSSQFLGSLPTENTSAAGPPPPCPATCPAHPPTHRLPARVAVFGACFLVYPHYCPSKIYRVFFYLGTILNPPTCLFFFSGFFSAKLKNLLKNLPSLSIVPFNAFKYLQMGPC